MPLTFLIVGIRHSGTNAKDMTFVVLGVQEQVVLMSSACATIFS